MKTKAVPWIYHHDDDLQSWTWLTEHFEVTIRSAEDEIFYHQILDLSRGEPHPVHDGRGATFRETEDDVLEFIGKAYPMKLHYREFAGSRATTFLIYSGERIDFGPYEGTNIRLEVKNRNDTMATISGTLKIVNFDLIIRLSSGEQKRIPPQWIIDGRTEKGDSIKQNMGAKGRTVTGEKKKGCTGTVGYTQNTVDHGPKAAFCPIHHI